MVRTWLVGVFAAMIAVAGVAAPQKHSASLERVLEQLDDQARDFHGLSADVERTKVTVVVNDKSTESGTILVHGDKMRLELKNPDERTILRTGDSLFIFNPKLNRVEEFNLGKYKAFADQYLLLGFGTPGRELKKGYLVTLLGEPVIDGEKVAELELTPKSEAMRDQISKIQLWIEETTWLPVQQQFFETGSEDYFIVKYTNIVRNPQINESEFKPHWPKGAEKIKPQG
ncbi:MAG: outer membrane lipoprotein-sorting protein [Candidatus Acidiferrales bacterium]